MKNTGFFGNVLVFSILISVLLLACNKDEDYTPSNVTNDVYKWKVSSGPDFPAQLNGLAFSADNVIWSCGDSGALFRSDDNGITWSQKSLIHGYDFNDIEFNGSTSWLCGSNGLLVWSNDYWNTHDTVHLGIDWNLNDIYFQDESIAWMVGSTDANGFSNILKSKNGGNSWSSNVTTSREILNSVFAFGSRIWAVGMNGAYIYSSDSGQHWTVDTLAGAYNLKKVFFPDSLNGFIAGEKGLLLKSADGGITWSAVSTFTLADLYDIYFLGTLECWICGDQGKIFHSTDGGLTWKVESTGTGGCLKRVMFSAPNQGIAVGYTPGNKSLSVVYQLFRE